MITMMNLLARFVSSIMLVGLLTACANTPVVRSDYDPRADFASYRTFAFMEPLGTDRAGYTTLVTERLKRAATLQMESRGYAYRATDPDLLINFQAHVSTRTDYVAPPPMPWGFNYYGYRSGFYGAWPGYGYGFGFGPDVIQYQEGVLNIDLIDAKRKQMVWEGVGSNVIDDIRQATSSGAVEALVAAIFARYPFIAGSANPGKPAAPGSAPASAPAAAPAAPAK